MTPVRCSTAPTSGSGASPATDRLTCPILGVMTSVPNPDGPPDEGAAFRLPDYLADDPDLSALYRESIRKLRAEALGLPMHTVQEFLLERIATKYVILRYRERTGSWLYPQAERDSNDQWLALVKEWNRALTAGNDAMRDSLLRQVEEAVVQGLEQVADPETRKNLRLHFKEKFSAIGY